MLKEFDTDKSGSLCRKEFDGMMEHIDKKHRSLPPTAQVRATQSIAILCLYEIPQ